MPARRSLAAIAAAAFALASLAAVHPAYAVDRRAETAAKDALKKTASDYAASDFATAAARLDKALAGCAGNKCSPDTKAFVLRDLGTMQFKMGDKDAAANSFAQALQIDHDIDLSTKYDAPDVRAAWKKAQTLAATGPGAPPPEQPIGGDFTHTPPTEQKIRTPLPIYVEPPEGTSLAHVVVKYKGSKMDDWSKVELSKMGEGWGGVIPCGAVMEGPLTYWVQGFDASGQPAASSGDPKHPFTVPIRDEISGDAPALPDKPPPKTCAPGETGGAGEGEGGSDEGSGVASRGRYARLWVGLGVSFELMSMPSADNACVLAIPGQGAPMGFPLNSSNLYCTDPTANGADFPSRSGTAGNDQLRGYIAPGRGGSAGQSRGGIQPGDIRLLLSVDYAMTQNLLLGGRLGYVANAYPGSAAGQDGRAATFRVHVEARATYLLGSAPLEHVGFAPLGMAGLGLAEFDGHVSSFVGAPGTPTNAVDIWDTDGPFFLFIGAGARYAFSPRIAATAAIRLNLALGGNGALATFGPEFGVQYGF
ncbi:MAG: outer membrane protein [Polyangiaceae bacterium]